LQTHVFLALLAAAAMHAGWNAIVKLGLDRLTSVTLVMAGGAAAAAPLLLVFQAPAPAAFAWLAVSIVMHTGYNFYLARALQLGDYGQMYPIARGTAPLLTTIASSLLFGEHLGLLGMLGVLVLVCGVWVMALGARPFGVKPMLAKPLGPLWPSRWPSGLAQGLAGNPAIGAALTTAMFIAGYSLSDGWGARASGSAHGYIVWLTLFDGLAMLALFAVLRGTSAMRAALVHWRPGLIGGLLSFGAYWIAIWAFTQAPIGMVAALRETSVLFASIIAVVWLGEPLRRSRMVAAALIVAGAVLLRLA
jgi:drug/metabolite transporter (DMT)-like permease